MGCSQKDQPLNLSQTNMLFFTRIQAILPAPSRNSPLWFQPQEFQIFRDIFNGRSRLTSDAERLKKKLKDEVFFVKRQNFLQILDMRLQYNGQETLSLLTLLAFAEKLQQLFAFSDSNFACLACTVSQLALSQLQGGETFKLFVGAVKIISECFEEAFFSKKSKISQNILIKQNILSAITKALINSLNLSQLFWRSLFSLSQQPPLTPQTCSQDRLPLQFRLNIETKIYYKSQSKKKSMMFEPYHLADRLIRLIDQSDNPFMHLSIIRSTVRQIKQEINDFYFRLAVVPPPTTLSDLQIITEFLLRKNSLQRIAYCTVFWLQAVLDQSSLNKLEEDSFLILKGSINNIYGSR